MATKKYSIVLIIITKTRKSKRGNNLSDGHLTVNATIKTYGQLMDTIINDSQIIETFAKQFVKKTFRDRFMHEAIKKPQALHRRICHEIAKVFDEIYKGENTSLENEDICLFLGWFSPITHISWKEAKEKMSGGGGGYLVIKADGSRFYAETEAYPAVIYSGQTGR